MLFQKSTRARAFIPFSRQKVLPGDIGEIGVGVTESDFGDDDDDGPGGAIHFIDHECSPFMFALRELDHIELSREQTLDLSNPLFHGRARDDNEGDALPWKHRYTQTP